MKKAHKKKPKQRKQAVKTTKAAKPRVDLGSVKSVEVAVLERLNGGADETTKQLRALTRTKDKTIQSVLVKAALDTVVESALAIVAHNKSGGGQAAEKAVEKSASNEPETKTVSETKESKTMLVAHAEQGGVNGTGSTDTGGRVMGEVHDIGLGGGNNQAEKTKHFLGGRRPGQKVVYWHAIERQQMAKAIVAELMSRGVGQIPTDDDRAGGRLLLECARVAQGKALPIDRHRELGALAAIKTNGILDQLPAAMKAAQAEREAAEKAEAKAKLLGLDKKPEEPAKPPVDTPPVAAVAAVRTEIPPLSQEELADPILAAANALIVALRNDQKERREIKEMYALIMEDVDGLRKRVEATEAHQRTMEKQERKEDAQAKAALPVVAILGCRKDQFDEVCTKAKERGLNLTFRHYDQDWNPRPINAQWAITFRWVRHSWDDQIKASISPRQSAFIHGGISQGVAQLELWFGGEQNQT